MFYKLSFYKIAITILVTLFFIPQSYAQTKKIKRPKSRVGISSVDRFVRESFDLYDKVYKYDGYAQTGTPLEDEDIDVLEDALDDVNLLSESAPDILSDLDGQGVLKQGKATLQINRAKKVLAYSIKTAKELLLGERKPRRREKKNLKKRVKALLTQLQKSPLMKTKKNLLIMKTHLIINQKTAILKKTLS